MDIILSVLAVCYLTAEGYIQHTHYVHTVYCIRTTSTFGPCHMSRSMFCVSLFIRSSSEYNSFLRCAIFQTVSHWLVTCGGPHVRSQGSSCANCGEFNDTGEKLFPSTSVLSCQLSVHHCSILLCVSGLSFTSTQL
jgi:hypothetical protein